MINKVKGVDFIEFEVHGDDRGSLVAIENEKNIPFSIKRVYFIFGTQQDVIRGKHAHQNINQVLLCVNGKCEILLYDGINTCSVVLDSPNQGIFFYGFVWREMYNFSENCVLLSITDSEYLKTKYYYDKEILKVGDKNDD